MAVWGEWPPFDDGGEPGWGACRVGGIAIVPDMYSASSLSYGLHFAH